MLEPSEDAEARALSSHAPSVTAEAGAGTLAPGSSTSASRVRQVPGLLRASFLSLRLSADDDTATVGRRPAPWREAVILIVIWALYTGTRTLASDSMSLATHHANAVLRVEKFFNLNFEKSLNAKLSDVLPLEIGASYWYSLSHYIVTVATLVALYRLRPLSYGWLRSSLVVATVAALACFVLFPTAPPRLTPGYTDTLIATSHWGWWSDHASIPRGMGSATNQLAAMPSMHAGWALWCTIVLYGLATHYWQRVLAVLYSVVMGLVVVATANHWVLDLFVGWGIVLAAMAGTRAFVQRRSALRPEQPAPAP